MTVADLLRAIHECRVVDAENTEILLDKGGRLAFVDADIRCNSTWKVRSASRMRRWSPAHFFVATRRSSRPRAITDSAATSRVRLAGSRIETR